MVWNMSVVVIARPDQCSRTLLPLHGSEQISVAHSRAEAAAILSRTHFDAAVVDLECVSLDDVVSLIKEWNLGVVCVHRVADENLWLKALHAGALDCCYPDQVWHALQSVRKHDRQPSVASAA